MVMGTDDPRHHQFAVHFFDFRARVTGMKPVTHSRNFVTLNGDIDPFADPRRFELSDGGVFQNQHNYFSTRPNR